MLGLALLAFARATHCAGVLPVQVGGVPCVLKLPDAAAEGVMHCPASTGRLARVKMADTPRPRPSLRRARSTLDDPCSGRGAAISESMGVDMANLGIVRFQCSGSSKNRARLGERPANARWLVPVYWHATPVLSGCKIFRHFAAADPGKTCPVLPGLHFLQIRFAQKALGDVGLLEPMLQPKPAARCKMR